MASYELRQQEPEKQMAREMRDLGFKYVRSSDDRSDYGTIILSRTAIAQVKSDQAAVERAALTNLFLARGMEKSIDLVYFSRGGYTAEAFAYADHTRIALFTFDHEWESKPVNAGAIAIYDRHAKRLAIKEARRNEFGTRQRTARPPERGLLNLRILGILAVLATLNLIGVAVFDIQLGFGSFLDRRARVPANDD